MVLRSPSVEMFLLGIIIGLGMIVMGLMLKGKKSNKMLIQEIIDMLSKPKS